MMRIQTNRTLIVSVVTINVFTLFVTISDMKKMEKRKFFVPPNALSSTNSFKITFLNKPKTNEVK